ncbi:20499_t:CDS:2 [Dentiscutata erythropus]|uniref:20499_t:CDS:1 n=1 Tax=Dentiscutata erythropus TaxID=1348616 RepID=A0A9N9EZC4_9GLOM|nr:20499_t:CDS:2 [Dentiscutata erythropus]
MDLIRFHIWESREIGITGAVPSEHSEYIPTGFENIENDDAYLLHRSNRLNDDNTSASVPAYDTSQYGYDDDNDNEEDEGPYEALKRQEDSKRTPLQNKLYYFFEVPVSKWAKVYSWLSLTVNLASISILCIDSIPSIMGQPYYDHIWYCMDITFVTFFTIEYIFRFYASSNKLKYLYQPSNVIDLISITAIYIQIIFSTRNEYPSSQLGPALRFVGILRLFRIVKLLHISKHTSGIGFNFSSQVFIRSAYQLLIGLIYALIIIIVSSVFMYYAERGELDPLDSTWYRYNDKGQRERSPYQSIVHSFWWAIVTITTTGYGDIVPVTPLGKLIAGLTMALGILVIALPTTIIGSNFMNEWAARQHSRNQSRLRKSREKTGSLNSVERLRALQVHNDLILETILEIQDRLAEIRPPNYYIRYKSYKEKHRQACERISELEHQLEKQKRITNNFDIFIRKTKSSSNNSDSTLADNDTDNSNKRILKFPLFRRSQTISCFGNSYAAFDTNFIHTHDNKSETKLKFPKMFSIDTLKKKIGRTFSTDHDDHKSSKRKKKRAIENTDISAPIAVRPAFTPIIDSGSSANSAYSGITLSQRPPHRRNHSSPEMIPTIRSVSGHSGGSVNPIINNKPRGIFIQDSNVNYPIHLDDIRPSRVIKVDQGDSTSLASHSKDTDIDRIEILVDEQ